ncbi:MAG: hypothetical protein AAF125_01970 [Chloroflexota bacterium]
MMVLSIIPVFHIRVIDKIIQHPFSYTVFGPALEAFKHTIPFAIVARQQTLLRSTATDPLHGFDETTTIRLVSHIGIRVLQQKVPNFRPFIVSRLFSNVNTTYNPDPSG